MLRALRLILDPREIVGIVNVGDDLTLHGLRICPDLDTITYTLAGLDNTETGWGRLGETWRAMAELELLGGEAWFSLGDLDLATHLYRTQRLAEGASLSTVTRELLDRRGVDVMLLPATDDPIATEFTTTSGQRLSFQEYFVKHHHDVEIASIEFAGAAQATPAPHVLDLLETAERIIISPSNPLISIQPILAIPGIAEVLRARRDRVVAVSPLIGGRALKGPADRLLVELAGEASNVAVAAAYDGLLGTLLIDAGDSAEVRSVEATGIRCIATPTLMSNESASRSLAKAVLDA